MGYFILHPFVMVINEFMHYHPEEGILHIHSLDLIISSSLTAFSPTMLPWALAFTIFGATIGYYYGTIQSQLEQQKITLEDYSGKLEKKVEERTEELQKAYD